MSMFRTRWAAIGAAVAVTLGAGGIGLVGATTPSDATTLVPITPCRVFDTRPEFQVGPRNTPLGPGDVHTVTTHGDNGNCTGIPSDAVAVSMNVTAVGATSGTFLTIWETGQAQPGSSSLNPTPGAPPAPNAVTTNVDGSGRFDVYNLAGNVDVFADVNGYYVDHDHDDRYYTRSQTDAAIAAAPGAEAAYVHETTAAGDGVAASVTVDTPTFGYVIVNVNATAQNTFPIGEGRVFCSITTGEVLVSDHLISSETLGPAEFDSISGTRAFNVSLIPRGLQGTYRLACDSEGSANLSHVHLNATFIPDTDAQSVTDSG